MISDLLSHKKKHLGRLRDGRGEEGGLIQANERKLCSRIFTNFRIGTFTRSHPKLFCHPSPTGRLTTGVFNFDSFDSLKLSPIITFKQAIIYSTSVSYR